MTAQDEIAWLRDFIEHRAVFRSPLGQSVLTSKHGTNNWQFYLPVATLDAEFACRMADLFWQRFAADFKARPFQLCACETGGVAVACALQAAAFAAGQMLPVFALKKQPKDYGLKNWVEGIIQPRPVLLVDDVIGGRQTLTRSAERLRSFGLEVIGAFAVAQVKDGPLWFKLGEEKRPIAVVIAAGAFALSHEQYFAKYGKIPRFDGVLS